MLDNLVGVIVIFVIVFVFGFLFSIQRWPEWFRRIRSAHWPTVTGTIESGEVSTLRGKGRGGDQMTEIATANLAYSFQLNGTYYSGYHAETFGDEQDAWSYVDGLKGTSVVVSYHPRKPEISVLRHQSGI